MRFKDQYSVSNLEMYVAHKARHYDVFHLSESTMARVLPTRDVLPLDEANDEAKVKDDNPLLMSDNCVG